MSDASRPFAAAADWGTSSFRLWLLARDGTVLGETRSGDGMMTARETGFEAVLERHLAEMGAPAGLPVVVCGMAGAKQGWREAAYLDVPAPLSEAISRAVRVEGAARDVRILAGIAQRDPDWPDVMRGEETQLIGTIAQGRRSGLVCMPGTHSKWVALEDGTVSRFATFMTGDTFAALSSHSILRLAIDEARKVTAEDSIFAAAVREALEEPALVSSRFFAVRAGPLLGVRDAGEGAARLSGGLIGMEVGGAQQLFGALDEVMLVASGRLGDLYRAALGEAGARVINVDADEAVRAGLHQAALSIWGENS